jgi:hypothetical protein
MSDDTQDSVGSPDIVTQQRQALTELRASAGVEEQAEAERVNDFETPGVMRLASKQV